MESEDVSTPSRGQRIRVSYMSKEQRESKGIRQIASLSTKGDSLISNRRQKVMITD